MQGGPIRKCFSQNSLLLNFSLVPLTFKPKGIKAGKSADFCCQSFCFINKYDFILMSKHQKTDELMVCQITFKGSKQGQIIDYWNYQELSFGKSDQIRVFKDVKVGKLGWGSKLLSEFMSVGQRGSEDNNFYIKFDRFEKKWMGCWGSPQKNLYIKIQNIMDFIAKERNISYQPKEYKEDFRLYAFEWLLSSNSQQAKLHNQPVNTQESAQVKQQEQHQKKQQIIS